MTPLTVLLVVLVVLALGGGLGHGRFGYAGWSPLGVALLVALVLWATGYLR